MRRAALTLTQAAERLGMPPSNVRAFLERRGVHPVKRGPDRWSADLVDAIARQFEADSAAREADRRRVETRIARAGAGPNTGRGGAGDGA